MSCGNCAVPEAWHPWHPALKPPSNAAAWLPSKATATTTATATITSAAMIMDIFFIATSLPTPLLDASATRWLLAAQTWACTARSRRLATHRRLGP